ncbi:UNVERIFIED_CONTAM: hypothetical protein GTU68_016892 [Idotea baltica]|nr:hypothetical protein [Idotea baltica]
MRKLRPSHRKLASAAS